MAKLNTNSNVYTIGYAIVMVVIVAFLLAFISQSLREKQEANVKLDYKKQVLDAGVNEYYELTDAEQKEFIEAAYGLFDEMAPELGEKGLALIDVLKDINGIA